MTKPIIDPELAALMQPLPKDKLDKLHASLDAEGCLDSLKVWDRDGESVLLDGHNRLAYCEEHGIAYTTETIPGVTDTASAVLWMANFDDERREKTTWWRGVLGLAIWATIPRRDREGANYDYEAKRFGSASTMSRRCDEPLQSAARAAGTSDVYLAAVRYIKDHLPETTTAADMAEEMAWRSLPLVEDHSKKDVPWTRVQHVPRPDRASKETKEIHNPLLDKLESPDPDYGPRVVHKAGKLAEARAALYGVSDDQMQHVVRSVFYQCMDGNPGFGDVDKINALVDKMCGVEKEHLEPDFHARWGTFVKRIAAITAEAREQWLPDADTIPDEEWQRFLDIYQDAVAALRELHDVS
jgi:hypothetical protein